MPKLNQAQQFNPSQENLAKVLAAWNIRDFDFQFPENGVDNITVLVQTSDDRFVLKIYKQGKQNFDHTELQIELCNFLHHHGLPVALSIPNQKDQCVTTVEVEDKSWRAILMEHLPGIHVEKANLEQTIDLAHNLGKFHVLSQQFCQHKSFIPTQVLREPLVDDLDVSQMSEDQTKAFFERAKAYAVPTGDLPQALLHADCSLGNLLFQGNQVSAILDFDDMFYGPLILDIAVTIRKIMAQLGVEGGYQFLQTYQSHRPLQPQEKRALQPILLFRIYRIGAYCYHLYGEHSPEFQDCLQQEQDLPTLDFLSILR